MTTSEKMQMAYMAADLVSSGDPTPRQVADAIGVPLVTYRALLEQDEEFARIVSDARRERVDALVAKARSGLAELLDGAVERKTKTGRNGKTEIDETTEHRHAPDFRAISVVLTAHDPNFGDALQSLNRPEPVRFEFDETIISKPDIEHERSSE